MTASIREGSVRADGVEIKYVEAGAGEPVVYLHGADGLRLTEAHRHLAEKNRFIAFRIPALHALEERSRSQKLTEIATALSKAAAALGLERFSLMGHSVGADLALRMAIARSDAVKAVILIAPTATLPPSTLPMARVTAEPAQGRPAAWFKEDIAPELASQRQKVFHALKGEGRDQALEAQMGEIAAPVLVLLGTSDEIVSTDVARIFSSLLPKCYTVMVYDATHDVEADRPEAVADIVGEFLAYGEGFMINRSNAIINP
jgi:pimeloyl-ACP methyl ester carboxylesterase